MQNDHYGQFHEQLISSLKVHLPLEQFARKFWLETNN